MKNHEKKRLPVGVKLEHRRYIGFHRQPVEEPEVKPIVRGLPNALNDVLSDRYRSGS